MRETMAISGYPWLFLWSLLSVACARAPGDADQLCTANQLQLLPAPLPANAKILMDSYDYILLLPRANGGVWQQVDLDDNNDPGRGTEWTQNTNIPCRQTVSVCGFEVGPQNNWLITQYISRRVGDVLLPQVSVQVVFEVRGCVDLACQRTFVINIYETFTENSTIARETDNYEVVSRVAPDDDSGLTSQNQTREADFTTDAEGFYIAIRDETTCIVLQRLIVFYNICPGGPGDLVMRTETIAPPVGHMSQPLEVTAQCVEGASPIGGGEVKLNCNQGGVWIAIPGSGCNCDPGLNASADGRSCIGEPITTEPIDEEPLTGGVYIGVAFAVAAVLVVTLAIALVIGVYLRRRQRIKTVLKNSGYRRGVSEVIASENEEIASGKEDKSNAEKDSIEPSMRCVRIQEHLTVSSRQLTLGRTLGQGEFGVVYKAKLMRGFDNDVCDLVAVKTLRGFVVESNIDDLRKECVKMSEFDHPNVLMLIGVCLDGGPAPYIIMPFMENGSLLSYLKKERENLVLEPGTDEDVETQTRRLVDMCLQVAKGMEYLANRQVIHRDLAARNCMIDLNFVIKVADFGLSESIDTSKQYFRQDKHVVVRLPIKWLAPESINDGIFSEKTDVWSYGVTCWEIFSGGKTPYPGIHPVDLPYQLDIGHRMKKPLNEACSDEIFSHMLRCWENHDLLLVLW